ncbi:hypothetical protein [Sphingopyxis sp. MWB1]|uniref:hypothetical protein n=1 Tax=Sphingopyxis sp. MWB1 TaxID=1537715 RepID=UPI00051A49FA|nr:hypothetical protein [Sphingopyxis sp. MWB1]
MFPIARGLRVKEFERNHLKEAESKTLDNSFLGGFKIFSQVDEDSIIETISSRIPEESRNKTFIEIGCGRGVENNPAYLVAKGYRGAWVDGISANISYIQDSLPETKTGNPILLVDQQMIHVHNVVTLLEHYKEFIGTNGPEYFSLDIDSDDAFALAKTIKAKTTIVCVEYNGKFLHNIGLSIEKNDGNFWRNDNYPGASLATMVRVLNGYRIVTCSLAGSNAFCVRKGLARNFAYYTAGQPYRPAQHELIKRSAGQPPSLKLVRDALAWDSR